ncbi:SURF1-like protein [Streptomyces badius]
MVRGWLPGPRPDARVPAAPKGEVPLVVGDLQASENTHSAA